MFKNMDINLDRTVWKSIVAIDSGGNSKNG